MKQFTGDARSRSIFLTRIVTVYRQWPELEAWLEDSSLREEGVEWIFVNDEPGDEPKEAIRTAVQHLGAKIVTPPRNLGRCGARNLGVREATGEWVEHIDGDDRPLPVRAAWFDVGAEVGCLLFPVVERDSAEFVAGDRDLPWDSSTHTYWGFLFPEQRPIDPRPAGIVWRRRTYLSLGGYDDRLQCSEDLELVHRAVLGGVIFGHVPRAKQCYRLHANTTFRTQKDYRDSLEFFMRIQGALPDEAARRLELVLGRQLIAFGGQFLRETWVHRRALCRFLWSRMTGRFSTFKRADEVCRGLDLRFVTPPSREVPKEKMRSTVEGMQAALAELLMLSSCRAIISSPYSTFSQTAAVLRGTPWIHVDAFPFSSRARVRTCMWAFTKLVSYRMPTGPFDPNWEEGRVATRLACLIARMFTGRFWQRHARLVTKRRFERDLWERLGKAGVGANDPSG